MAGRLTRCVLLAVLFAAGCSEPESVQVRDESKSDRPTVPAIPADQKLYRTLAAMVPVDSGKEERANWWFIKLSGKADVVAKCEADFNKIIDSLQVSSDAKKPIAWTLPPGWKEGEASMMRYATLKAPEGMAEVSVSQAGGVVQSNVQRWWGQLWGKDKEAEVTAANLPGYIRQRLVNGRYIIVVDISGPKDPNANLAKMMNPHEGQ